MLTKVLVDAAFRTSRKCIQAGHQVRNLGELPQQVVLEGLLGLFHLRKKWGKQFYFIGWSFFGHLSHLDYT